MIVVFDERPWQRRKILDSLKKERHLFAAGLLETRILECSAAQQLATSSLASMPLSDLRGYVKTTQSLWAMYPVQVQVDIASRFVSNEMDEMIQKFKQGNLEQATAHVSAVLNLFDFHPNDAFDGNNPRLADTLQNLCNMAEGANESAEQEMDIENLLQAKVDDQQEEIVKVAKERGWDSSSSSHGL